MASGINPDLTSIKARCVLNKRVRITSPIRMFFFFILRKERWFSRRSCAGRNRILSCQLLHLSWQKSGLKVTASSFDLLAVLPRSQLGKTALEKSFKRPVAHRSKKTRSISWVSLKTNIYRVQLITSILLSGPSD